MYSLYYIFFLLFYYFNQKQVAELIKERKEAVDDAKEIKQLIETFLTTGDKIKNILRKFEKKFGYSNNTSLLLRTMNSHMPDIQKAMNLYLDPKKRSPQPHYDPLIDKKLSLPLLVKTPHKLPPEPLPPAAMRSMMVRQQKYVVKERPEFDTRQTQLPPTFDDIAKKNRKDYIYVKPRVLFIYFISLLLIETSFASL